MSSDPGFTIAATNRELDAARRFVRDGRLPEAEQAFRNVLAAQPEQVEALRFLANAALARGAVGEAVELLNRAANVDRNDVGVLMELGAAYRSAERMDAARYVLERALELSQGRSTTARLLLANVLELDQRPELALVHYFRAILDAQTAGQWLDDNSTEPGLRRLVQHAMRYAAEGRHALFDGVLQPLRHGINAVRLGRIERALAIYLRDSNEAPADPRQRPSFLYVPELGAAPFLDNARFEWLDDFLARIAISGAEADALFAAPEATQGPSPFSLEAFTLPQGAQPPERRIPLYQRGLLLDAARQHAPQLIAALDDTPLVRVPRHGPDAEIIALSSGARSSVRYGRTNSRCIAVVALPGSARLRVIVGGEPRELGEGQALVGDPSFGVDYVNASEAQARALAFEIWHPDLIPLEREALTALTAAVVDFDGRLQEA